jgi:hypothetical protein
MPPFSGLLFFVLMMEVVYASLKRPSTPRLNAATYQKTPNFILAAVRT